MTLTTLRLSTLQAMKTDALDIFNDRDASHEALVSAARVIAEVDLELERRMDWAKAAQTFVNGDI
jgi:hypothetical protein